MSYSPPLAYYLRRKKTRPGGLLGGGVAEPGAGEGVSGWTPDLLSNAAWFDFTDLSKQTLSGSIITAITSKGSYALTATPFDIAPTSVASSLINSKRAGRAEGAGGLIAASTVKWRTMVAIYYTAATNFQVIAAVRATAGDGRMSLRAYDSGNVGQGTYPSDFSFGNNNTIAKPSGITIAVGRNPVASPQPSVRANGVQGTPTGGNFDDANYPAVDSVLLLSSQYNIGTDNAFTGDCLGVIFCNMSISDADAAKIEGWASWSIMGDGSLLPVDHPHKSAAP
jgi:hypothetical protein